jgi:hypothetical protein
MALSVRSPMRQAMATAGRGVGLSVVGPLQIAELYMGVKVPDPITFVMGPQWLNRPNLYPRQATLLKIIFLRDDLFTDYDHQVIAEWIEDFDTETNPDGISPDIYERIAYLKARGYKWFREVLLAIGRRGGKGYISALAYAYVLWNYMAKGDPQDHYGIADGKQLVCLIFGGKKEQATKNLWGDLNNVITNAPCFTKYLSRAQTEGLTVYAPHDLIRLHQQAVRGINSTIDMASFAILPKESTTLAGRGPASFALGFDEMAHVVKAVAKNDAGEVYEAATPSLDQFGEDGFMVAPSSTWAKTGKFYELAMQALEREDDEPVYPEKVLIQLPSWGPYLDWEQAHTIEVFPRGFVGDLGEYADAPPLAFRQLRGAIQIYNEQMARLERANPDTFRVERRSYWQAALDAYLDSKKVSAIFSAWDRRPEQYGPPQIERQSQGLLVVSYKAHGDPANVNCRFGFAVAHEELAPELDVMGKPKVDKSGQPVMMAHAVFDLIHYWDPADFPDHTIDYDVVTDWIWDNVVLKFHPEELTFDQYNSPATVQKLQKKLRSYPLPKHINVFQTEATAPLNWKRFEVFKAAINMGLVHAPEHKEAQAELTFLTKPEGVNRVDPQTTGPVQTKDIADCLVQCVYTLLGEQMNNFLNKDLRNLRPAGGLAGGVDPMARMTRDRLTPSEALSGFARSRGGGRPGQDMPRVGARGMRRRR